MLKLRIALGLALIVAILTAAAGIIQGTRPLTLLYRAFVSLATFSLVGFLLGSAVEALLRRRLLPVKTKGQNVDITDRENIIATDELINPSHAEQPFSPLIPDQLERIQVKE